MMRGEIPGIDQRNIAMRVSQALHARVNALREKLERKFAIRLSDEEFIEYLTEKVLERVEAWETLTAANSPSGEGGKL